MHEQSKSRDVASLGVGAVSCIGIGLAARTFKPLAQIVETDIVFYFGYLPTSGLLIQLAALATLRKFFFARKVLSETTYAYVFAGKHSIIPWVYSFTELSVTFLFGWIFAFVTFLLVTNHA